MMKAHERYRRKFKFLDGSIVSAVIWQLPEPTKEKPHGYQYRLQYCSPDGSTLVRYDNHTGKADHKHLRDKQVPYKFQNIDKLLNDFWRDVEAMQENKQYE